MKQRETPTDQLAGYGFIYFVMISPSQIKPLPRTDQLLPPQRPSHPRSGSPNPTFEEINESCKSANSNYLGAGGGAVTGILLDGKCPLPIGFGNARKAGHRLSCSDHRETCQGDKKHCSVSLRHSGTGNLMETLTGHQTIFPPARK